ncbi:hypothetical protein D3C71_1259880 [compost metagenome]
MSHIASLSFKPTRRSRITGISPIRNCLPAGAACTNQVITESARMVSSKCSGSNVFFHSHWTGSERTFSKAAFSFFSNASASSTRSGNCRC